MNRKIFLILLFSFVIRLYHIDFTVIGWQAWRQADTAAIAKNFHEEERNIFYPRIDWRGDTEGFVESEFHIYPFIVSLFYSAFGLNEMWGRLLSVIFSTLTVLGIFLLVKRIISEKTALWSAFIYAVLPLNIYYARAFMPEATMLMCSVYGIYFFTKWIDDDNRKNFILSALFIALAALVKLPALYLGLPLMYLCIKKYGSRFVLQWKIWLFVILVLIPVAAWYYHAHMLHMQTGLTFSIWNAGVDKWGMIEPLLTFKFYNDIFFKSIAERHLTYAAFIIFLWGLFLKRANEKERLFDWWLIGVLIFILLAPQAHLAQEYYQLPFNIPASVFIAKVFSRYIDLKNIKLSYLQNKFAFLLLSLLFICIFILSFLRMQNFMKSENTDAVIFSIAEDANKNTGSNEKFITVSEGNPAMLYIIDRKGWVAWPGQLTGEFISEKVGNGAKFIAGEKNLLKTDDQRIAFEKLKEENKVIAENDEYYIIELIRE